MTDTELLGVVFIVAFSVLYFMVAVMNYRTLSRADRKLRLSDMSDESRRMLRDVGYDV